MTADAINADRIQNYFNQAVPCIFPNAWHPRTQCDTRVISEATRLSRSRSRGAYELQATPLLSHDWPLQRLRRGR